MSRTAGIVVFVAAVVVASTLAALHLVYGWRPAPRVDRDVWPEGVGWTW